MKIPQLEPVKSSMFTHVGYDAEEQNLFVKFNNGSIYVYKKVSQDHYDQLTHNESPGRYFSQNIKNSHDYQNVG